MGFTSMPFCFMGNSKKVILQDPVRASAWIGLVGGLALGDMDALALLGGSWTGMNAPSRMFSGYNLGSPAVKLMRILGAFSVAAAMGGILHASVLTLDLYAGTSWGGVPGLCSFTGTLLFLELEFLLLRTKNYINNEQRKGLSPRHYKKMPKQEVRHGL